MPKSPSIAISPVQEIITELRAGRMIILVDEEDRENEGDLVLAADHVSAEAINFMAKHGRGLICLTLTKAKAMFFHCIISISFFIFFLCLLLQVHHSNAFSNSLEQEEKKWNIFELNNTVNSQAVLSSVSCTIRKKNSDLLEVAV